MRLHTAHLTRLALTLLLLVSAAPLAWSDQRTLTTFDGKNASISDYTGKGKWTIVMIWAHDCSACNQEVHQYNAFHTKHRNIDATILGISSDGKTHKKDADDFIARHKVVFPNLIGEPETIDKLYYELTGSDWEGTPAFLVYTPAGELVVQQIGAVPVEIIEEFMARESKKNADSKT